MFRVACDPPLAGRSGSFRDELPGSGSGWRRGPGTAPAGRNRAAAPVGRGRGVGAGFGYQRQIGQDQRGKPQRHRARQLTQQVAVSGVAVLAVFPFDVRHVRAGVPGSGFKHRIRRRQDGENRRRQEDERQNAEPARIPQLRRNRLQGYAASVHAGCLHIALKIGLQAARGGRGSQEAFLSGGLSSLGCLATQV